MSQDARPLILAAFAQARRSGKLNWRRMSIAVLKNRMLILTQNKFTEANYGAATFSDFLRQHLEILSVDRTTYPPTVELRAGVTTGDALDDARPIARPWCVRSDLWNAIIDYRSGSRYVWDEAAGIAVPVTSTESGSRVLPTVSPSELKEWRDLFAATHEPALEESEREHLRVWRESSRPTRGLPPRLRERWNSELKRRVVARLERWFAEQSLTVPANLHEPLEREAAPASVDADSLRRLVLKVVRAMTQKELLEIRLPASAILRASRRTGLGTGSVGVPPADRERGDA